MSWCTSAPKQHSHCEDEQAAPSAQDQKLETKRDSHFNNGKLNCARRQGFSSEGKEANAHPKVIVTDQSMMAAARITPHESPLEGLSWTVYYEVTAVPISTSPVQLTFADPTGKFAPFSQSMLPGPSNYTVCCQGLRGYPQEADLVVTLQVWTGHDWITLPRIEPVTFSYRKSGSSQLTQGLGYPGHVQWNLAVEARRSNHSCQVLLVPRTRSLEANSQQTDTTQTSSSPSEEEEEVKTEEEDDISGDEREKLVKKAVHKWLRSCQEPRPLTPQSDCTSNSVQSFTGTWVGSAPDTSDLETDDSAEYDSDSQETTEESEEETSRSSVQSLCISGKECEKQTCPVDWSSIDESCECRARNTVESSGEDAQELKVEGMNVCEENESDHLCRYISSEVSLLRDGSECEVEADQSSAEVEQCGAQTVPSTIADHETNDHGLPEDDEEITHLPVSKFNEEEEVQVNGTDNERVHHCHEKLVECNVQQPQLHKNKSSLNSEEPSECENSTLHQNESTSQQVLKLTTEASIPTRSSLCDPQYPSSEGESSDYEKHSKKCHSPERDNQSGHNDFCPADEPLRQGVYADHQNLEQSFSQMKCTTAPAVSHFSTLLPNAQHTPPVAKHEQDPFSLLSLHPSATPLKKQAFVQLPKVGLNLYQNSRAASHFAANGDLAPSRSATDFLQQAVYDFPTRNRGLPCMLGSLWTETGVGNTFFGESTNCSAQYSRAPSCENEHIQHEEPQTANLKPATVLEALRMLNGVSCGARPTENNKPSNANIAHAIRKAAQRKTILNHLRKPTNTTKDKKQTGVFECNQNTDYIVNEMSDRQAALTITVDHIITSSTDSSSMILNRYTNQR